MGGSRARWSKTILHDWLNYEAVLWLKVIVLATIFLIFQKIHSPSLFLNAGQIEFLFLLLAPLSLVKLVQLEGMARLKPEVYFPAELFFLIPPVAFSGNRKTVANCVVSSEIAHFFVDCIPAIQILMIQCQICNFTWSL